METAILIGVMISVVGGFSLAGYVVFKDLLERSMLKLHSLICYEKIAKGEGILWEEAARLYETEMEKLTGLGGQLTPPEGNELVVLLNELCEKHLPEEIEWKQLLQNLDESTPRRFYPHTMESCLFMALGFVLLVSMIVLLDSLLAPGVRFQLLGMFILFLFFPGLSALIALLLCGVHFRWFFQVWRGLRKKSQQMSGRMLSNKSG